MLSNFKKLEDALEKRTFLLREYSTSHLFENKFIHSEYKISDIEKAENSLPKGEFVTYLLYKTAQQAEKDFKEIHHTRKIMAISANIIISIVVVLAGVTSFISSIHVTAVSTIMGLLGMIAGFSLSLAISRITRIEKTEAHLTKVLDRHRDLIAEFDMDHEKAIKEAIDVIEPKDT